MFNFTPHCDGAKPIYIMKAHTRETQATMTPEKSLQFLKEGNLRFQNNLKANRNLLEQVNDTSDGQFPFATILSCIDSRVSAELVFDQGLGDIFSIRIAGNFVNEDILGSMEFACKLAGTKLIVVLGHTSCGAVKGACDDAKMGNLTKLISKIKPAVKAVKLPKEPEKRNSKNLEFVDNVAEKNVFLTIDNIRKQSHILTEMEKNKEIMIVGAMYDISDGSVTFFE
jgi:carbonic anhydrase